MTTQRELSLEERQRQNRTFEHLQVAIRQHFQECYYNEPKNRLFLISDIKNMPGEGQAKIHFQCSLSLNEKPPKIFTDHCEKASLDAIEKHHVLKGNVSRAERKLSKFLDYASEVKIRIFITESTAVVDGKYDQLDFHVYVIVPLHDMKTMTLVSRVIHSLDEIKRYFLRSEKFNHTCSNAWF